MGLIFCMFVHIAIRNPSLRQVVNIRTRGCKLLDVILTNLHTYYNVPVIVPPIPPDVEGKGAPSDHCGIVATPHSNSTIPHISSKIKKLIRPIPESLLPSFEKKLSSTDFSQICTEENSTKMVQKYQEIINELVTEIFPLKSINISSQDQAWFNEDLRALRRTKMREYERHGKSPKYCELKAKFESKFLNEIQK